MHNGMPHPYIQPQLTTHWSTRQLEKGVKGSDKCCISICDFSPRPFDILRCHLPVFSVSTLLIYHLSRDQLSQLSASTFLCLKEPLRLLTALCYCVCTMWTKSSWNLPENLVCNCLLLNFKLIESTGLHSKECHDTGIKKNKIKEHEQKQLQVQVSVWAFVLCPRSWKSLPLDKTQSLVHIWVSRKRLIFLPDVSYPQQPHVTHISIWRVAIKDISLL